MRNISTILLKMVVQNLLVLKLSMFSGWLIASINPFLVIWITNQISELCASILWLILVSLQYHLQIIYYCLLIWIVPMIITCNSHSNLMVFLVFHFREALYPKTRTSRDPNDQKRTASNICWYPDNAQKLAVAYSVLEFQRSSPGMCMDSYIWDVG